jgi:hypothetical protein
MASQLARVRQDKRLRPDQVEALNARLARLPAIIAARENQKVVDKQIENMERQEDLAEKQMKQQERASRAGLGVEVVKAGAALSGTSFGKGKGVFGSLFSDSSKSSVSPTGVTPGLTQGSTDPVVMGKTGGGLFSTFTGGLTMGNTLGSAALGFGGGMLGTALLKKKNPLLGAGIGAGVGLLSGLFGQQTGSGLLSSGLFGGLGGLAGGFV